MIGPQELTQNWRRRRSRWIPVMWSCQLPPPALQSMKNGPPRRKSRNPSKNPTTSVQLNQKIRTSPRLSRHFRVLLGISRPLSRCCRRSSWARTRMSTPQTALKGSERSLRDSRGCSRGATRSSTYSTRASSCSNSTSISKAWIRSIRGSGRAWRYRKKRSRWISLSLER